MLIIIRKDFPLLSPHCKSIFNGQRAYFHRYGLLFGAIITSCTYLMLSPKRIPGLKMRVQPYGHVHPGTHKSMLFTSSSLPLLNTMAQLRNSSAASMRIASSQSTQTGAPNQPPSMSNHCCSAHLLMTQDTSGQRNKGNILNTLMLRRELIFIPKRCNCQPRAVNTIDYPTVLKSWGLDSPKSIEMKLHLVRMWPLRQIFR